MTPPREDTKHEMLEHDPSRNRDSELILISWGKVSIRMPAWIIPCLTNIAIVVAVLRLLRLPH